MSRIAPEQSSPSPFVSSETRHAKLGTLALDSGIELLDVELAYRTWGRPGKRAILICHALTGSADADDWWSGLLGEGRVLDPRSDFVVCSNVLGSCYGSTGPLSLSPATAKPYQSDFPSVTIRDIVRAQALLLDELGIEELELVIGGSMGGMQVLEWGLLYPDRVEALVPVATSGRHSPWCIGLSEAQRQAIMADPKWQDGRYSADDPPSAGLSVARMIALCSYRSWASFKQRFERERRDSQTFQVESYLNYQGQKLVRRFDANAYMTLTHSMDSHDIARDRGDYAEVLSRLELPSLVLSVSSDMLYQPPEQAELARHLAHARLAIIDSPHGHDGFLIEFEQLGRYVREFRVEIEQRRKYSVSLG